ncbi:spore germination protein KB [Thermoanaerobacter kivui]|uniref:Spore germination protein KB n=1 Tax=Thermoanaerobacter kivui TaxID=2325 RepID=A0A097ATC9_THEKI|nr:endospore germination permease [Thermoanaerobacter kivui]AIS53095.1 spore germination protein KB [Thermoanaerobacter kivui]
MLKKIEKSEITSGKKLSMKQFIFLIIIIITATESVCLPSFVASYAKEDSWLSVIISTIFSAFIFLIYYKLAMIFKEQSLFEYIEKITGKFIGKIISILYLLFCLNVAFVVTRQLIEIMNTAFMPETPALVFLIVTTIPVIYAVSKGLFVIAKMNEILLPFGIFALIFLTVMSLRNVKLDNFTPILAKGILPPLIGSFPITSWILESVILLVIFPHIEQKEKTLKGGLFAIIIVGFVSLIGVLPIGIFGAETTANMQFPILEQARNIRIENYTARFDVFIVSIWITGIYIKIAVFIYFFLKGIEEIFKCDDYRFALLPMATFLSILPAYACRDIGNFLEYLKKVFTTENLIIEIIIPVLLFIIAKIKKLDKRN